MRLRKRTLSLVIVLAAIATALILSSVVGAASPRPKMISAEIHLTGTCYLTGTYTWSGWGGKPKGSHVEIEDFNTGYTVVASMDGPGGASGSLSVNFTGTSGNKYLATGWLTDQNGKLITTSPSSSSTVDGTC
jgi:hypothetical protein